MFDRKRLVLKSLKERVHDLDLSAIVDINKTSVKEPSEALKQVARDIVKAKKCGSSVILMAGGHVIRSGVQKFIIDLMEKGYISCLAMNGSGMIHDFEFSMIGATTESVARYIKEGQFGLWKETGRLNDIINDAYKHTPDSGMGEAVGKAIYEGDYHYKNVSILATAFRLKVPVTIHVGIGYDIIHEHPNCDGAATGALSYNDFLRFVSAVEKLENGVVMDFGSAVMAPEVFLKSLSMARNIAKQSGKEIDSFTTLVCDLRELPDEFGSEPDKNNEVYYFRPWKTMLVRTSDGGRSFYVKGPHAETLPSLWKAINDSK